MALVLDLLGADHDTIVADHWVSFDRELDVESELKLESKSGGILPLAQDQHAEIMRTFLRSSPSARVFGDRKAEIQERLLARVI